MILQTASEGVSLAKQLENESAIFYEGLAQQYPQGAEAFLALAKENKKNIAQIERVYYGVITDAIEGCYAFHLDPDHYTLVLALSKGAGYGEALAQAAKMEETIIQFYTDAADQAKSLMADVPRTFALIARKRGERLEKLKGTSEIK